jgi:signal peptidase I
VIPHEHDGRDTLGISKTWFKGLEKITLYLFMCMGFAILMKWGVVAGYSIPTSSMQPFLNGDPEYGDKVAVFKLQYKLFEPNRYDLVVFFKEGDFPIETGFFERGGGMNFVKRLVGFPGEKIQIKNGDLYFNGSKAPDRKPLEVIRSLLIPVYRYQAGDDFLDDWQVTDGAESLHAMKGKLICDTLSSPKSDKVTLKFRPQREAINDDYLDDDGDMHKGSQSVRDLALSLEVEFLEGGGQLFGHLDEEGDEFWFSLQSRAAGGGGMTMRKQDQKPISSEQFPGFEVGETYSVCFMNMDNRILLLVDDELIHEFVYDENTTAFNNDVYIGVSFGVQNARVRLHDVRIDRDIHYTNLGGHGENSPYPIPEGRYFFLGDNSSESEDSRVFGAIPKEDLVGRPFMIFYPFNRIRWF